MLQKGKGRVKLARDIKNTKAGSFFKWLCLFLAVIFSAAYISANWYQLMLIQGDSMLPAYHNLQLVVIDKHSRSYKSGDVIAFKSDSLNAVLVKRIAACPGDTAQITEKRLYINGSCQVRYEKELFDYAGILSKKQTLFSGQYIVIGDNVSVSRDSREEYIGKIKENAILGRVCLD